MAATVRARLERGTWCCLRVWIVAGPALALVRIVRRDKPLDHLPHFVTTKAVLLSRHELLVRLRGGIRPGERRGELVTRHAMQARLSRHLPKTNLRLLVTAGLRARLRDGHEPVRRHTVTC
jgi:hypothetical protein